MPFANSFDDIARSENLDYLMDMVDRTNNILVF